MKLLKPMFEYGRAPDGQKLMVMRPKDPGLALKLAETARAANDQPLFQSVLEAQDYVFKGYLGRRAKGLNKGEFAIVSEDGRFLEEILPGDSFITETPDVEKAS